NWMILIKGDVDPRGFDATSWAKGMALEKPTGMPIDWKQAERLRKVIVEKNQLYFHRWRPQNDTYLFGFRKHEQGNNAVEIPQFDPLIAKLEADIAKLRVPVAHKDTQVPGTGASK